MVEPAPVAADPSPASPPPAITSTPGPLADGPRRLHPLSPVAGLVFSVRELFGLVVVALSVGAVAVIPVGIVVVLGVRYWAWWRFTFVLERDPEQAGAPVLRVDSGILQRNVRRVPLDRVQRVEVLRRIRHRVLGLAVLRLDTAGGGSGGEVDLDALSNADAAAIRRQLDAGRRGAISGPSGPSSAAGPGRTEVPAPVVAEQAEQTEQAEGIEGLDPSPEPPLVRPATGRLVVAGITGAQLFVMLAAAAWLLQVLDDLPWASVSVEEAVSETEAPRTALSIGLGLGAVVVLWLALAAGAAVLTYHGFSIVREGGDLHVRRGLLDVRETVVPLRRVQAVRVEQNLLRRPLGLASVRIVTAGDPGRESGHVVVPALRSDEVDALLDVVLPGAAPLPPLAPAPPAARRRALSRRVAPVLLVVAPLLAWLRSPQVAVVGVLALALAVLVGLDAYRGLGLARAGRTVVTRVGSLVRTTWLVPDARVQSVRVRCTPFQRRRSIATLHLDVAGQRDAPRVVDQGDGRCRSLAAEVLAATVPG